MHCGIYFNTSGMAKKQNQPSAGVAIGICLSLLSIHRILCIIAIAVIILKITVSSNMQHCSNIFSEKVRIPS